MHPHVPPVSRVTLFKGGLNLQRGRHPTFDCPFTVLQFYR